MGVPIFLDGYDHYATEHILRKWDSTNDASWLYITQSGRRGKGALRVYHPQPFSASCSLEKELPSDYNTIIVGFAFKSIYMDSARYLRILFSDGATTQSYFSISNYGTTLLVRTYRGDNTLIASQTLTYTAGLWLYMEAGIKIGDADGTYELRINGNTVMSGTGDTKNSTTTNINKIILQTQSAYSGSYEILVDDFYALDAQGDITNSFLGDCRIDYKPAVEDIITELTPTSGVTNYDKVDDEAPNEEDYVYHTDWSQKDIYAHGDLETLGEIFAVQPIFCAKGESGYTTKAKNLVRIDATDYAGSEHDIEIETWNYYSYIYPENPLTTEQWVKADVSGLHAGIQIQDNPE